MSEKDLEKWLKRLSLDIHFPEEEPRPLCRLDLVHTVEGEGFEKLESLRITDDSDIGQICQTLYGAAEHDAGTRTSGQVQRYTVLAFRDGGDRAQHESSFAFVVRANSAKLLIGGDTEPPTEKGLQAHYMRHDENMHRILMQTSEGLIGRFASELNRETTKRIEAETRIENLKALQEDLLDRKHERELERQTKLQQARFFAEMTTMFTALAPLVVGKLLAGKDAVVAPNARDLGIQKLLKGLSHDEIKGVLSSLKPGNQIALMELYQSYAESEKAADEKKEPMLRDEEPTPTETH